MLAAIDRHDGHGAPQHGTSTLPPPPAAFGSIISNGGGCGIIGIDAGPSNRSQGDDMAEHDGRDRPADRSWLTDALAPIENLRVLTDAAAFGRHAGEELPDRLLGSAIRPPAAESSGGR